MSAFFISLTWAGVIVYGLIRAEKRVEEFLKTRTPLNNEQYNDLNDKIDDLKTQISSLAIRGIYEKD